MTRPTTTSYSLLGLLALQPWTAYELVGQTQRSMRFFWPRSEAHVYGEVKRLVKLGWADAANEAAGKRHRTRYSITPSGRAALNEWLDTTPAMPMVEIEAMVRLFFADQGTVEQLVNSLTALRDQADSLAEHGRALTAGIVDDGGPFPNRIHLILPLGEYYYGLLRHTTDWADRVIAEVATWDSPADRPPTAAELARLRDLAEAP